MTPSLAGLTVVVTRPERQARHFIDLATRAGATCLALPAIAIDPVTLDPTARALLAPDAHDWTIYTSSNAVEASLAQLPRPVRCKVAAVGRATAQALEAHGITVQALPAGRSDSEGLLAHPAFANVHGQRMLILRGAGGRDLLREQLQLRGATVRVGELYRRRPVVAPPGALDALDEALRSGGGSLVVAVTSVDVLDGLLNLVTPELAARLRTATVLLPGERVAAAARARLWTGAIVVAGSAEDAAMLAALEGYAVARGALPPP